MSNKDTVTVKNSHLPSLDLIMSFSPNRRGDRTATFVPDVVPASEIPKAFSEFLDRAVEEIEGLAKTSFTRAFNARVYHPHAPGFFLGYTTHKGVYSQSLFLVYARGQWYTCKTHPIAGQIRELIERDVPTLSVLTLGSHTDLVWVGVSSPNLTSW